MGTIISRRRKDGSTGHTAQIVKKKNGHIVWREAKTFNSVREAKSWAAFRERELDRPGAIEELNRPVTTLRAAIEFYEEDNKSIGRTKEQVLRSIKSHPVAEMDCALIRSHDIVQFATDLLSAGRKPQTVGNYVSHLSAVFRDARPSRGIQLDPNEMKAARDVLARQGRITKSSKRERRPTIAEIDRIMQHFIDRQARSPRSAPMHVVVAFAIFSTRRLEEICRIRWVDLDEGGKRVLVRDMKHPGQKRGNDVWCEMPDEALAIALSMPRGGDRIFPISTDAVGAAFTRACQFLAVDDLHFHDLRHEGVSRLFEMGRTIPQVASVSGHRSWPSLQRYGHLRQVGDKWADWHWLKKLKIT
ncbi:tyrosine-type recombinase/integrase [Phreatobacter sp. AB_2022a]|uniref:tyrosine-type recombinase/integrase n=1 Tax=Phreatobacter sp. AB_2022a TaxID=3003134 RepID=UPI00228738A6|nr:tyrosine-type recombinase/integrase [Phreatobacter sp. AB_2022a]MCZ0734586.1 tyrosine-type recombinase/integrase [Phreatobacter sp. AB_2022a]